jgi:hypothetical protein
MIERDSSLAAQAHSGLATLYRKAGSAVKAQHQMAGTAFGATLEQPKKGLNLVQVPRAGASRLQTWSAACVPSRNC